MDKISLIKELIANTEDEAKLKEYNDQLIEEIKAQAKEEARTEAEREFKAQKAESTHKSEPKIEAKGAGHYKGYDLDGVVRFTKRNSKIAAIRESMNGPQGEKTMKHMIDMIDYTIKNPGRSKAAMQEGTDSEGGYLTPTEQAYEVLSYVRESSVALQDAQHMQMKSDVMTLPRENAKVTVAITAEEGDATEAEPTIALVTLTAKRYDAYSLVSNELLEDSAVSVPAMILDQCTEALGLKIDSAVFKGTGDPVSGIFGAAAGYSEVFSSGSTNFSAILESNIRNIIAKMPPERIQSGAKWYTHYTPLWQYIRGLRTTTGEYMFAQSAGGGPAPGSLWGFPIRTSSQAPSASAVSTAIAVLGNMQGVIIGDRLTNMALFADPYTEALSYQTRFFFFTRWAIALGLPNNFGRIVTAAS